MDPSSDALHRIVDRAGVPNLVEILATDLPGADFTTLMLHVLRERAARRPGGRGYYLGFCFKTYAEFGPTTLGIGDGGFVDWMVQLTGSHKERCLTSGLGVERIALAMNT